MSSGYEWTQTLFTDNFELGDFHLWDYTSTSGKSTVNFSEANRHSGKNSVLFKMTDNDIKEYITAFKDHAANACWLFREEPDNFGYDALSQKRWWDLVKQNDPKRPVEILLMGYEYIGGEGAIAGMRKYHWPYLVADIYSWDIYPVENEASGVGFEAFAAAQDCAKNWNMDLVPTFPNIQSADCTPGQGGGTPTPDEIQLMCWLMIVHGAKGIHWYPYQGDVPPENFLAMKKFVADVTNLTEAILGAASGISVTTKVSRGARIDVSAKTWNNKTYIFAVNLVTGLAPQQYVQGHNVIKLPGDVPATGVYIVIMSNDNGFCQAQKLLIVR
jgi:hypothetical protein